MNILTANKIKIRTKIIEEAIEFTKLIDMALGIKGTKLARDDEYKVIGDDGEVVHTYTYKNFLIMGRLFSLDKAEIISREPIPQDIIDKTNCSKSMRDVPFVAEFELELSHIKAPLETVRWHETYLMLENSVEFE